MGEKRKSLLLLTLLVSLFLFQLSFACNPTLYFNIGKKLLWYISFSSISLCCYRQHANNYVIRFVHYHLLLASNSTFKTHSQYLEHVYMRPELNSNRFEISNLFQQSFCLHGNFIASNLEISNCFQKLFRLHENFTAATLQTIARLYCACANDIF